MCDGLERDARTSQRIADQRIFQLLATPGSHKAQIVGPQRNRFTYQRRQAIFNIEERRIDVKGDQSVRAFYGYKLLEQEWAALTGNAGVRFQHALAGSSNEFLHLIFKLWIEQALKTFTVDEWDRDCQKILPLADHRDRKDFI